MAEKNQPKTLKIDDVDYNISDISDNAKAQMHGVQAAILNLGFSDKITLIPS